MCFVKHYYRPSTYSGPCPNILKIEWPIFDFMQVDDALIDKLSRLAMLDFDAAEREEIKDDLQKMIGFIDKLK